MNITAIHTRAVTAGALSITDLLDESITSLHDGDIIAITSKIVSLCENAVLPLDSISRDDVIKKEADYYLPAAMSKYKHHFTIKNHTLIAGAGVDESNGGGFYVLWPRDSQASANMIRDYLMKKFGITKLGVIITDSTCHPLRLGTSGIFLAHSGFLAVRDYIGQPDIFGKPFGVTQANIATGLAAAAVVIMGEGSEKTPFAVISDVDFVQFQDRHPIQEELDVLSFDMNEDLFAPFLKAVEWKPGNGGN